MEILKIQQFQKYIYKTYVYIYQKIEALKDIEVLKVSAGWGHSAVLSTDNIPYLFGRTHDIHNILEIGQWYDASHRLAKWFNKFFGKSAVDLVLPEKFLFENEKIVDISTGMALTFFLTESGKLYSFGDNEYGQCGQGSDKNNIFTIGRVIGLDDEIVTKVICGFQHVMCLTKSGNIYGWGKSTRGQLGIGENDNLRKPMICDKLTSMVNSNRDKVIDISLGFSNGLGLTANGKIYTWGKFQSLKPNFKKKIYDDQLYPRRIDMKHRIVNIHSNMYISILQDIHQNLYMYGLRDALTALELIKQGKLRENNGLTRMVNTPKPVNMVELNKHNLVKIISGNNNFFGIDDNGVVYKWDWINPPTVMKECENLFVKDISVGWRHTLLSAKPRT